MRPTSYQPGLTYYLMALLALGALVNGLGVLFEFRAPPKSGHLGFLVSAVLGFVMTCTLALGWHRFTLRRDGLYVRDLKGARFHGWGNLGRPRSREFVHGSKDSILFDKAGMRGGTDPQAFSHHIRDARGRTLYHIGPWYPRRREMMREIRRYLRETADEV